MTQNNFISQTVVFESGPFDGKAATVAIPKPFMDGMVLDVEGSLYRVQRGPTATIVRRTQTPFEQGALRAVFEASPYCHHCGSLTIVVGEEEDAKFACCHGKVIHATPRHDAGAFARCSYCGRYSDNPKSLEHEVACECGTKMGWSGSFCQPNKDSKWSRP